MKKIVVLLLCLSLLATTGCSVRRILMAAEDHPTRQLTNFETIDQYWLLGLYQVGAHYRYWTCVDGNESLDCKVLCDNKESSDLDCVGFGLGK
ncbi:MAG TPA: hypothetical protein P5077_05010 [bacterium]|nr:hypothetical protein [bacterium]